MSEFWVSKKKYFCKYCDIYIADDAPSRQQHENGLRHQGNKARFVRDIYKNGERRKRDLEEEKRELVRVQQAANEAYANDILSGDAKAMPVASTSRAAAAPAPRLAQTRSSDPYANYSTAESLGFVDEEAQRLAAEKALRLNEGRIGEWTTVSVPLPPASSSSEATTSIPAPPVDEEDTRGWKLDGSKRRRIAVGLGDIYDPGEIKVKKKEGETPPPLSEVKAEEDPAGSGATSVPHWTPRGWLKPGEAPSKIATAKVDTGTNNPPKEIKPIVTSDDGPPPASVATISEPLEHANETSLLVKVEEPEAIKRDSPPAPPAGALFRKRKAPTSGAGTRGSRR